MKAPSHSRWSSLCIHHWPPFFKTLRWKSLKHNVENSTRPPRPSLSPEPIPHRASEPLVWVVVQLQSDIRNYGVSEPDWLGLNPVSATYLRGLGWITPILCAIGWREHGWRRGWPRQLARWAGAAQGGWWPSSCVEIGCFLQSDQCLFIHDNRKWQPSVHSPQTTWGIELF